MFKLLNKVSSKISRFFQPRLLDHQIDYTKMVKHSAVATVAAATLMIGSVNADGGEGQTNLETIYHVYIKNERIGTVDEKSIIEKIVNEKIKNVEKSFSEKNSITLDSQVSYIPEKVFRPQTNNAKTVEALNEKFAVMAEAAKIAVDGKTVGYVANQADAEEVVRQIKLKYVPEEILNNFQGVRSLPEDVKLDVGDSKVIDVHIKEIVSFSSEKVFPEDILTIDEAVELLQKGTLEPRKHIVESGEVLGRIALNYDLSLDQIFKLNPGLTEETILQIGDELNVQAYESLVHVVMEKVAYTKQEIPFETEIVESDDMFKGDTKVKQEGKKGKKSIRYTSTKVNGEEVTRNILEENILEEPQNKIIVKGTKVIPSRGIGSLAWPAVGGYISSPMGYRWGRQHKGIDIARPSNRSILAADNGVVEFTGWDGGYGNKIVINHNNGMKTIYAHLSEIKVKRGQTIARGSKIGVMGTTGNSTGIHLHFEVIKNGRLIDPQSFY